MIEPYDTDHFNGVDFKLYHSDKESLLISAEDVGRILGYSAPKPVIESIYRKHREHIDPFVKCDLEDKIRYFNLKGVTEWLYVAKKRILSWGRFASSISRMEYNEKFY